MSSRPPLAMSTSWNARSGQTIGQILDAIRDLGIRRVELGYLKAALLDGLVEALAERGMSVQSLHNPCPWPVDESGAVADGVSVDNLASTDEPRRRAAVEACRGTIDLARRLGALAVVVHLGHIDVPSRQHDLFDLVRQGRLDEMRELRDCCIAEREAAKGPFLRAALASIQELGRYAADAGISLGVETRDGYREIPSLAEVEDVFAATDGTPVYYWHDVGHVEKQQTLGLATHAEWIGRYGSRLLGTHLHDTILETDHYAPGYGQCDLAGFAAMLPVGALRTLELGTRPTVEEARQGVAYLRRLGLG